MSACDGSPSLLKRGVRNPNLSLSEGRLGAEIPRFAWSESGGLRRGRDAIDHRRNLAALGVAVEACCCDPLHVLAHDQPDELRRCDAALVDLRLFESAATDDDHRLEQLGTSDQS